MYVFYVLIFLYLILMLSIGLVANKFVKNEVDFLLASRRISFIFLVFTMAATHFGGGFITGSIEYTIIYGAGGGVWYGLSCGLGLILLSFIASRLRGLSLFTAPEYLEIRYDSKFIRLYAALASLIALIGILSAQIIAASKLLGILHINPVIGGVVAVIIFILYTYLGGMWAVTLTDVFQIIIAIILIVILAIFAYNTDAINNVQIYTKNIGLLKITSIVLPTIMYTLIGQDFYQRLFSSKDIKTAKYSSLVAGILLCILTIFPLIIGLSVAKFGNTLDEAMGGFFQNNSFVIGIIFVFVMLAAIMSTADSILSAASSHIVKDMIAVFYKKPINQLRLSKISVLLVGLLALFLSYLLPSIIDALVFSYTIYTSTIFVPLILGIFWKKGDKHAAIISMIISTIVVLLAFFISPPGFPFEVFGALFSFFIYLVIALIKA